MCMSTCYFLEYTQTLTLTMVKYQIETFLAYILSIGAVVLTLLDCKRMTVLNLVILISQSTLVKSFLHLYHINKWSCQLLLSSNYYIITYIRKKTV